jgi:putative ATP-dependent endonuclease of OLD family
MRLESLRIQHFRACRNVTIDFDDYTCLAGPNGSGKSTVLTALNILFRNTSGPVTDVLSLSEEDFHNKDTGTPVQITATFGELEPGAQNDLVHYVRQGKLIMKARAEWDPSSGRAEVRQLGVREVMKDFARYFEENEKGARAPELKALYEEIRKGYPDLPPPSSKANMEKALHDYEEARPELCELMDSRADFYGFTRGENLLSKYIKWVYVPAVKDASQEQDEAKNNALGDLLKRTIRTKVKFDDAIKALQEETSQKYQGIISGQQHELDGISKSMQESLREWSHPGAEVKLRWSFDPSKSVVVNEPMAKADVGEGGFLGEVARMGHGMQRAFVVTVLHELATSDQESEPTLLLGFEEPELYQHPPQAMHLSTILEDLGGKNAQVLVTTHSPYFVSGKGFEKVRLMRRANASGGCTVSRVTPGRLSEILAGALGKEPQHPSALMAAIEQIVQPSVSELYFCSLPVFVEGGEDVAYISTYLKLSGLWTRFRKLGGNFIVCDGKTNLSRPLAIAVGLSIPHFVVFDGDSDKEGKRERHARDNACIFSLCGVSGVEPVPMETCFHGNVVVWCTKIGDEVRNEIGTEVWDEAQREMSERYGLEEVKGKKKNSMLITATLEHLWNKSRRSRLLERLCEDIITYGKAAT